VEVPLRVHEPHCHHRQAEVAALLEVIPRKEPKAPGIERERVVQPVLGREVRDGQGSGAGMRLGEPAVFRRHVPVEPEHRDIIAAQVLRVSRDPLQEPFRDLLEHLYRVVDALLPCMRVDLLEENAGLRVPAPPEVVGKVHQPVDTPGYVGEPAPGYQVILHRELSPFIQV